MHARTPSKWSAAHLRPVRGHPRQPDPEVVYELERALCSKLILAPNHIPEALRHVRADDLAEVQLQPVLHAIVNLHARGEPVELVTLADELDRAGELRGRDGMVLLAELSEYEATPSGVDSIARRVRRGALEREARLLHARAAADGRSEARDRARLEEIQTQLDGLEAGPADLSALGFCGDRLLAVRDRPQLETPLPEIFPPEPSLIVHVGRPKTAKTTLSLHLAKAWACGVAPWEGAPRLPGTRAAIVSAEQKVTRIDQTLRRLDACFADARRAVWSERLAIVARDPDLPPSGSAPIP